MIFVFEMDLTVNNNDSVSLTLNHVERRNFEIGISHIIYCLQLKTNLVFLVPLNFTFKRAELP